MPELSAITSNDYDVYQAGTTVAIKDSDVIAGNSLNIKVVAKGNNFKGEQDNIIVNYNKADTKIDIADKITSPIELGELSDNTAVEFLNKLQTKLVTMPELSAITSNDYDVYQAGTTVAIKDSDVIAGNSLNIKVVAKGNNFKGNQDNIIVNYNKADTKIDIADKITSPIDLGELSANRVAEFLNKLQTKLVTIPKLSAITSNDYDVYQAGTTSVIENSDIIVSPYDNTGSSLVIKIVAKGNNFKGNKDNITINFNKTKTEVVDLTEPVYGLAVNNNELYAGTFNNKIYKIDVNNNGETEIANLDSSILSLLSKGNELYAGTYDNKIYKIDLGNNTKTEIIDLGTQTQALSLSFIGNELYVGTDEHKIYQIDVINKTKTEIIDLGEYVYSLVVKVMNYMREQLIIKFIKLM